MVVQINETEIEVMNSILVHNDGQCPLLNMHFTSSHIYLDQSEVPMLFEVSCFGQLMLLYIGKIIHVQHGGEGGDLWCLIFFYEIKISCIFLFYLEI